MMAFYFADARLHTSKYVPYLYQHVASLIARPMAGIGTAMVDQFMRMYYDPDWFFKLSFDEAAAIIVHEDLHVLLAHHARMRERLGPDPSETELVLWNIAADLVVNQVLLSARMNLPKGWLDVKQFDFEENLSVERYYDLLAKEFENGARRVRELCKQGHATPNPGKGGGSTAADGRPRQFCDGDPETSGVHGMSEYDQQMLSKITAERIREHERSKGIGSVGNYLARMARDILEPPVNPFDELHALVRYAATHVSGLGDYTWKKIPRRSPPGSVRLPAHHRPAPRITVAVDTSGSMGERDLAQAMGVIRLGLKNVPAHSLRVMSGDTEAKVVKQCFRLSEVELLGGGGTDMGRLLVAAAAERPPTDAVVLVSDGFTPWPSEPVGPKVIVCITEGGSRAGIPAWIKTVYLGEQ